MQMQCSACPSDEALEGLIKRSVGVGEQANKQRMLRYHIGTVLYLRSYCGGDRYKSHGFNFNFNFNNYRALFRTPYSWFGEEVALSNNMARFVVINEVVNDSNLLLRGIWK